MISFKVWPLVRCTTLAFALVLAACATPSSTDRFRTLLDNYKQNRSPGHKAFAAAAGPGGAWAAGWGYGQATLSQAKAGALQQCGEKAKTASRPVGECLILYEDDRFLPPPTTVTVASPNEPSPAASAQPAPPPALSPAQPPSPPASREPEVTTGSGTFVSQTGLILTAEHVVRDASEIEVISREGKRARARIVAMSRNLDVAVLSADITSKSHFPLRINKPVAGMRVFTVGFPVVGVLGQEPKVSEGIISAASGIRDEASFMQMSVPIQPGNSGGPVITESGELVGVVTSSAAVAHFIKRTGTIPQNVNWAAKSSLAVTLLGKEGPARKQMTREAAIEEAIAASVLIIATK